MTKAPCIVCGRLVALSGLDQHIDRHKRLPHREGLKYSPRVPQAPLLAESR